MRLATFLEVARENILKEAVAFAQSLPALRGLGEGTLRDHLPQLLETISEDLRTPQSRSESISKSHGQAPAPSSETSAQAHGFMRAQRGITIEQLVAEFRALRSSILRLWAEAHPPGPEAIEDITRFNEAIDTAVAESVHFFAAERERWRQLFLGVLGHDLRTPLNAIGLTVELIRIERSLPETQTALLKRGVARMTTLLDSLLEYSRASFGAGMSLQYSQSDLAQACAEEIELLAAAHPRARIEFEAFGSVQAFCDSSRIREALANLVSNAIKHGTPTEPPVVRLDADLDQVRITVTNAGSIPESEIEGLFEPLRQRDTPSAKAERTHLGLGLFIARQIARAHGGEVTGSSAEGHVQFTIEIPRFEPPASAARSRDME